MQTPKTYNIIGLMSGTSGDGLDIAYCEFNFNSAWTFHIPKSITVPFPETMARNLSGSHLLSGEKLRILDIEFGRWMGEEVNKFCLSYSLSPIAIASHGHTVFHRPDAKNTLQIGNGWSMHIASGLPVINDFRMLDVQLGGQGAPLVPIGDKLLFPEYDYCLNLGGIANISYEENNIRHAFDLCPFNLLLNHFSNKMDLAFDDGGQLAMQGQINPELLSQLNEIPFYKKTGGKSLGREDIENDYIPLLEKQNSHVTDILATLVAHYVHQISKILTHGNQKKLIVTGGGAYNRYFVAELKKELSGKVDIIIPDRTIIDFKEALIFGFLGVLKIRNEINCLSSVTGSSRDNVGGVIYGDLSM
ncbi:MAG TPA: anhydro-N-acetylmuramic acid kinase [Anditalea sp.]|nr:anhydro-N-acetylmuramic acid kinase [Anditalea sp.]